jgi:hypothetical protein
MNAGSKNLIKLTVAGLKSERGHVRADEFLDELANLLAALNGFDRMVGQSGNLTLYYRIVAVQHASPLTITLEPVVRREVRRPAGDHIEILHDRFFNELKAIRRNEPISQDIDDQVLEHLRDLSSGADRSFKSITISNHRTRVRLNKAFEKNVAKLLGEEAASYGHVEGRLDAANIHGYTRRFWIYPKIGAQKIRCEFLPGESDRIREALGRDIRAEGLKYFRSQSPFPYRVAVKDFEILGGPEAVHLKDLKGIAAGATGDLSSVEFVRSIRSEWD